MGSFQLFDAVKLKEPIELAEGGTADKNTQGSIVEVLDDGESYLVELFGDCVKADEQGNLVPAQSSDPEAFTKTIGVELLYYHQLDLVRSAKQIVREQLDAFLDDLSEEAIAQVRDFAEFLLQKQQQS